MGFKNMCMMGKQGRDVQDRGGYGPDAGYMAEVQGIGNMKVVKVREDKWPGW